jgi:putative endonuclease
LKAATDGIDRGTIGAQVERAASAFLQGYGLVAIAANARYRDGDTLVFVEVRHRRGDGHGGAAASVDAAKQRKLVRAAQRFLLANAQFAERPCRFDVVEAAGDPDAPQLNWLRDAFRADDL